jgi:hypothetical protein
MKTKLLLLVILGLAILFSCKQKETKEKTEEIPQEETVTQLPKSADEEFINALPLLDEEKEVEVTLKKETEDLKKEEKDVINLNKTNGISTKSITTSSDSETNKSVSEEAIPEAIVKAEIKSTDRKRTTRNTNVLEKVATFNVSRVYYQEWYAGIKVGGTGINMFFPIENENPNIIIDSIYFRNLRGKLVKKDKMYFATLKNKSTLYTFKNTRRPRRYPVWLKQNQCAISYIQNGTTKYLKVSHLNEVAGIYYENGAPSIIATTDDEQ